MWRLCVFPSSFFLLPSSFLLLASSFYTYSLLIFSSLRAELTRNPVGFLPYVIFALKTCIPLRAVPKKSKNTASKNTTFEISEHPYRTCGSPGCAFFLFGSFPMSVFLGKTYGFLNILVQIFDFLVTIALASLPSVFSCSSVPPLCQFSFEKPRIFSTLSFKSWNFL